MRCENCSKEYKDILTHKRYCDKYYYLKDDVIKLYNSGFSIREISHKLKISKDRLASFLKGITRSKSESIRLVHKLHPEKFKHSEETKKKLKELRLNWMKNNADKTAWRLSNFSYPEKLMFNKFLEIGFDKKYLIVRERSFFPYFIDFSFENEKVALEIDGSQHLLEERKKSDDKKDKLLIDNGWRIIRVTDFEVKTNIDNIIKILEYELNKNSTDKTYDVKKVGIIKEVKKYIKKEKKYFEFTEKQMDSIINQRKVQRPSYKKLLSEISEFGYVKTGKLYGVSDNSIRKWIKMYEKYGEDF